MRDLIIMRKQDPHISFLTSLTLRFTDFHSQTGLHTHTRTTYMYSFPFISLTLRAQTMSVLDVGS